MCLGKLDPEYDIVAEQSAKQSSIQLREKRSRKKVLDAWAHFTRCDGEPRAACNYYACHPVKNGTSNMNNHLKFEPPSRRTLVRDVYQLYLDEKIALKNIFIARKMRVSYH